MPDPSQAPRTALVTGGSRGLGAAIARRLAAEGWHTVICGRDPATLEEQVRRAAGDGLTLHAVPADVTDEASVTALFDHLAAEAPPLEVCVANAGGNYSHRLVSVREAADGTRTLRPHPADSWDRTVRACLTGVFLTGRAGAELMLRQRPGGGGVLINISSAVSAGAYGQSAYCAAKAGVESLTRTWAVELGEYGIRSVAVSPGVIDGEALRRRSAASDRHAAYMATLRRHVPLRRWCTEEDIADAVVFAARNPSTTGTVMEVDGGGLPSRIVQD
ncbi:SDR family NAD(P)-dependent oxidoreductase [Streptomyces sp. NPDC059853]|uniref:SDR family NAD(P)-dependent oxidoreductase n=1 Tax=Streptomyces sp. NPDC059853 TaxID=3346973 RepID=UPI003665E3FB